MQAMNNSKRLYGKLIESYRSSKYMALSLFPDDVTYFLRILIYSKTPMHNEALLDFRPQF